MLFLIFTKCGVVHCPTSPPGSCPSRSLVVCLNAALQTCCHVLCREKRLSPGNPFEWDTFFLIVLLWSLTFNKTGAWRVLDAALGVSCIFSEHCTVWHWGICPICQICLCLTSFSFRKLNSRWRKDDEKMPFWHSGGVRMILKWSMVLDVLKEQDA